MTEGLRYEDLVAEFEQRLTTQLRGHRAGAEYLETWVPEADPVKSILNIVESAHAFGCGEVCVNFNKTTMNRNQQRELLDLVAPLGKARIIDRGESCNFEVSVEGIKP